MDEMMITIETFDSGAFAEIVVNGDRYTLELSGARWNLQAPNPGAFASPVKSWRLSKANNVDAMLPDALKFILERTRIEP